MKLYNGDCLKVMRNLPDACIEGVVTDPPYGLSLMGKEWDKNTPGKEIFRECLRVLKPGGYLISFGGTRTYHRLAVAVEDAGFEIRDMLEWIYNTGLPKSYEIGKAYDKKMRYERGKVGEYTTGNSQWEGYGTALKPAHEPMVLARKPLSEKKFVDNCVKHGTGAIDIDSCRIPTSDKWTKKKRPYDQKGVVFGGKLSRRSSSSNPQGRFPANLLVTNKALNKEKSRFFDVDIWAEKHGLINIPKPSKKERKAGCEGLKGLTNTHPTVKPVHLMAWLVRLISREGDTVLDPFMGSGTTGVAAKMLSRDFIGIEIDEESCDIAEKRIKNIQAVQGNMFNEQC